MAEIINLNRARKTRDRETAKAEAAANRVTHGLSRAQREAARAERQRLERLLDQSRRED
ncbi:MAG: DUF4169 family protein [Brevundimonas sp.]|uniref:DUF4169 family protein n=1 Tax=Brevundimonas sp. TaxID=1871086 RepID=UPI002736040C|nr:DUF4169 family protein [Brevundimonas sp.]MDP3403862.1 DUF4169 family protein [Brevundimonas sp.]